MRKEKGRGEGHIEMLVTKREGETERVREQSEGNEEKERERGTER